MTPTKPTRVDVEALRSALNKLTALQSNLAAGDPFANLEGQTPLSQDLRGMQENIGSIAHMRYGDSAQWTTKAGRSLADGVNTLVSLLTTTIAEHSKTDQHAAQAADATGAGAPAGGNSTSAAAGPLGAG